jgi:acetyl-CoA C-acetyltransferase
MHALATGYDRILGGRSARTLLTGNGGYFTKHAFVVLASEPPAAGFRFERPQDEVDAGPLREPPTAVAATAELETYTVTYDRDGRPESAIVTALDRDGCRHWAVTRHTGVVGTLVDGDRVGASVHFEDVGGERDVVRID